jgi:hypothetical protein
VISTNSKKRDDWDHQSPTQSREGSIVRGDFCGDSRRLTASAYDEKDVPLKFEIEKWKEIYYN